MDATDHDTAKTKEIRPSKGLSNTKLYVLDRVWSFCPRAPRRAYIGGAGVARGYLNRPELTAERFVKNPFGVGRLYRTGDIVRWREDGELDFFHRADAQVKINGLRIELGEIERQLETVPEIAQAVAVIHTDNHGIKRIFAFAVAHDSNNRPDLAFDARPPLAAKYDDAAALAWIENPPPTPSGKWTESPAAACLARPGETYRARQTGIMLRWRGYGRKFPHSQDRPATTFSNSVEPRCK